MANNKSSKKGQVSLAAAAGASKKKKKASAGTVTIRVLVIILVTLSLLFIGVMVYGVMSSFSTEGKKHDVQLYNYDTTPAPQSEKVSYFLLGLLGKDDSSAMDALTLVCYDKVNKYVNFLQVPTDTYIGQTGDYEVSRLGNVWNNPTPLTWCATCRGRVYEPEQKGGKHTVCGTKLTKKNGSAVESLLSVFNDQFSMPVDNYFLFSRDTLAELVDAVGGIDVKLESAMTAGKTYAAGKRVLSGKAAVKYVTEYNYNGTPAQDAERLVRQRKVWTALLQRMSAMNENELLKNVIQPLMAGPNPIRANTGAAAVQKMTAGIRGGDATFADALCSLIASFKKVDMKKSNFYILPGSVARLGSADYFGVCKADAVKLLEDTFNPYGLEMKEEHLQVNEIPGTAQNTDTKKETLQQIAVEQSAATTAKSTTTAAQ